MDERYQIPAPRRPHPVAACCACLVAIAGHFASGLMRADDAIITVNQHLTDDASGNCVSPPNCDDSSLWEPLPLDQLGQGLGILGNAYHVGTQCQVAKARCRYNPHARTKFLSSDVGSLNPTTVQTWIGQIQQSPHLVGQIHFEHYDECLEKWADQGNAVSNLSAPDSQECLALTGFSTTPLQMLNWIRDSSGASVPNTILLQNGSLHVDAATSRRLKWRAWDPSAGAFTDNFKRLVGSGYMGALAAPPERLDIPAYFRVLRSHNSNLIRVWSIEQWVALATAPTEGATPFAGEFRPNGYDLEEDNAKYYDRLRVFAQNASDRGIVVQLSLFDKHGIICPGLPFQYGGSPYKDANNSTDTDFLADTIAPCNCGSGEGPAPDEADVVQCQPLYGFIEDSPGIWLQGIHTRYLRRVGEEAGGIGNLIFEIINEALAPHAAPRYTPGDWPDSSGSTTKNQQWQMDMAEAMRLALPLASSGTNELNLARDAFNDDVAQTVLNAKVSDLQNQPWSASNVKVLVSATETGGLGTSRKLGYATSRAEAGQSAMWATLPFASTANWTKLQVRADLTCSSGYVSIGVATSGGHSLSLRLNCSAAELQLYQIGNCPILATQCLVGSATLPSPTATHNVRLKLEENANPSLWNASVFLDAAPVAGLQGLTLNSIGTVTLATLGGWNGSTPYPVNAGKVDNFEAARFCHDEAEGCNP